MSFVTIILYRKSLHSDEAIQKRFDKKDKLPWIK